MPDYQNKPIKPITPETIEDCKVWIANRTAQADQREAHLSARYPLMCPEHNLMHLDNMEATRFAISINQWELDEFIKEMDEEVEEHDNDLG